MKTIIYLKKYDFENPEFCEELPDNVTLEDYQGDGYYQMEDGQIVGGAYHTALDAKDNFIDY